MQESDSNLAKPPTRSGATDSIKEELSCEEVTLSDGCVCKKVHSTFRDAEELELCEKSFEEVYDEIFVSYFGPHRLAEVKLRRG